MLDEDVDRKRAVPFEERPQGVRLERLGHVEQEQYPVTKRLLRHVTAVARSVQPLSGWNPCKFFIILNLGAVEMSSLQRCYEQACRFLGSCGIGREGANVADALRDEARVEISAQESNLRQCSGHLRVGVQVVEDAVIVSRRNEVGDGR